MRRFRVWSLTGMSLAVCLGAGFGGTGRCVSAWASDQAVETVWLGEPEHVWWETDTVGKWSSVKAAHEYQVKLYISDEADRNEENWREFHPEDEGLVCVLTVRTSEQFYDFRDYMDDLHTYFFAVRATPQGKEQAYVEAGPWVASMDVDFREKQVIGLSGGTWRNYLEGSRYEKEDGTLLGEGWHLIQGYWYLLDESGYRLSGWQETEEGRYYLGNDGRMVTGWFFWGDSWYYADSSGQVQTGLVMIAPGQSVSFGEDGRMG